jgi:hypothetical protein
MSTGWQPDQARCLFRTLHLVVEDEASVAAVVRRILERNGYRVIVAGGPEEGLAVMQSRAVDAVLSDVIMPVMSGPEMMAKMGAEGRRPATVFMSGFGFGPLLPHPCPGSPKHTGQKKAGLIGLRVGSIHLSP